MRLPKEAREIIVAQVAKGLETLFDTYEEGRNSTNYVTMMRADGKEGFGAMLTLDALRVAALKIQMLVDNAMHGDPTDIETVIEKVRDDFDPERN